MTTNLTPSPTKPKFELSPAQAATLLHFGRLALWGALSALITFGLLPFLSTWLPALHVTNPELQTLILLGTPVLLDTLVHYRDIVNQLLQQEEQAKQIAGLQAQVAAMKAMVATSSKTAGK